jgi:hypothetical protein
MKKYQLFFTALLVVTLITSTFAISNILASVPYQLDANISTTMEKVNAMIAQKSDTAYSSNPYDYIVNDNNFKKIVALGPDALIAIKDEIAQSKQNGLREYILAIAAEKIAKVDLKKDTFNWSNGKEWLDQWKTLLRNIPDQIEVITSSGASYDTQNSELSKLGIVAIPYILDKIASGNQQYEPALRELLKEDGKISSSLEKADPVTWATNNKANFENLRAMVEEIQQEN